MAEGWISIHRKIRECDIWDYDEPFTRRDAWIDLLLLANHRDKQTIFDGKRITIKRGQYLTSVRKLATEWQWGKNKTLAYLRLLEECEMITRDADSRRTLITIVNYDIYQNENVGQRTVTGQSEDSNGTVTGHRQATNNNDNNDNNENKKNIYNPSFAEFWKIYPRKNDKGTAYKCYLARLNDGYSEEELLTACKNYAAECEREKRDKKYIKHGATFLGVNEPFAYYLKGENFGQGITSDPRESEERERGIEEVLRRIESGEADHDDDHLWDGLP